MKLRHYTTALLSMALAMPAAAQTDIIQSPAYTQCISLASSNPAQALAKADEWLTVDNSVAAYHCRAMALYGLQRFDEAANALQAVRSALPIEKVTLRNFVTKQASTAWKNANRADAALAILTTQLSDLESARGNNVLIARLSSELLIERANLNITYGKLRSATKDLDHAISLTPLNTDALIARATAFDLLGDTDLARADIEAALTLNPDHKAARALLAKLDQKPAKPVGIKR